MINYPNELNKIFEKLHKQKLYPIIVGGFVRDSILGIESKDIDIEVYNVSSFDILEEQLKEFGDVNSVGKSFGVCKLKFNHLEIDFTLPRVESKVSPGHRGFKVDTKENIDFHTAASRRDFTINSIGYDPLNKKILDPFNGLKDLKSKTLRATSKNTFIDDPLRALRAVQFCARFELTPDNELKSLIKSMIKMELLKEITKERIFIEIQKLLLKSKKPSIGFRLMKELNILDFFTELKRISESDLYNELLSSLDKVSILKNINDTKKIILYFTVISYYLKAQDSVGFLDRFTNDKAIISGVEEMIMHKNIKSESFNSYDLSKLAVHLNLEIFFQFLSIVKSNDKEFINSLNYAKELSKELNILNEKIPPLLQGRDLLKCGLSPSEEFGVILERAYEAQLKNEFKTHDEALIWLKKSIVL